MPHSALLMNPPSSACFRRLASPHGFAAVWTILEKPAQIRTQGPIATRFAITEYLLATDHPEGSGKAEFFASFGFTLQQWQHLADALRSHAQTHVVSSSVVSEYGTKYRIDGPLHCPDGRSPSVRSVWIVDAGEENPRLVTAHPI